MKKNKKLLIAGGMLAGVALLAGTYAWLQSEDEKTNHFEGGLAGNDVAIHETWEEPTDWTPGQSVVKEVGIMNTGKYNELIRVSFDEMIQLLENPNQKNSVTAPAEDAGWLIPTDITAYTAANGWTPANITMKVGDYTLKGFEKKGPVVTNPNTGEQSGTYDYVLYWEKDGKQYAAELGSGVNGEPKGSITRAGNDLGAALTVTNPVFEFVASVYQDAAESKWNVAAHPTFTWGDPTGTESPTSGDPLTYWQQNSQITLANGKKAEIGIDFVNIATPTMADNKWFYNDEDGYFYYLAVVPSGGRTVDIINSVKLLNAAGNEYNKVLYDLTVKAQAIQPIMDAVKDEWKIAEGSDLYNYLKGLVDKVGTGS